MTLGFVSNFMNHHQKPVADRLYAALGNDYRWIATTPVDSERIRLGYDDLNSSLPYILRTYAGEEERKQAYEFCLSCDCLLVAYDFDGIIEKRLKNNKLTVVCSERICKKSVWDLLRPKEYLSTLYHYTRFRNKPLYLFSIGDYTAQDYSLAFAFPHKCYRWGYFIDVPVIEESKGKWETSVPRVFWAARFLDWKHPEFVVETAKRLKEEGVPFHIEMAGTGVLFESIRDQIRSLALEDRITLLGALNHKTIREKMLQAHIFCLTSNRREGWGAVVSEALASRCITIASKKCGAASVLIRDGENGLLFKDNDVDDFCLKLKTAVINYQNYRSVADKGYDVMSELWNPSVAAERLLSWTDHILTGQNTIFETGPCSQIR